MIDTHAHLYLPEFDDDRAPVIDRALEAGVERIMLPNIDSASVERMNRMSSEYPGICYSMMGLHPTSVKDDYRDELSIVEKELKEGNYVGVGEIGIDLYWDKTYINEQRSAFATQLDLALQYNLPVVIHARESFSEILDIISGYCNLRGIFHAFSGDIEIARQVTGMGFKLGIGGMITYKKSVLPEVVREIPLEHLVLETDSPYLTPVPYRGKRNESGYLPFIAQAVEQIKSITLDAVAHITTRNTLEVFSSI